MTPDEISPTVGQYMPPGQGDAMWTAQQEAFLSSSSGDQRCLHQVTRVCCSGELPGMSRLAVKLMVAFAE